MAENQIEIEVVLDDSQAQEGLEGLETNTKKLGETFKGVTSIVDKLGGGMEEGFSELRASSSKVVDSFGKVKSAITETGGSFKNLLGPIGAAIGSVFALKEAFNVYTGEVARAEKRLQAYTKASSDLASIVTELTKAQGELTIEQMVELKALSLSATAYSKRAQSIADSNAVLQEQIHLIDEAIFTEKNRAVQHLGTSIVMSRNEFKLNRLYKKRSELQETLRKDEQKTLKLTKLSTQEILKMEKQKQKAYETSLQFQRKLAAERQEIENQTKLRILRTQADTLAGVVRYSDHIVHIQQQKAVEQLKHGKITVEMYTKMLEAFNRERAKRIQAFHDADRAKRLANFRAFQSRIQAEQARMFQLELENMRLNGASEIDILEAQYTEELRLAKRNRNLQIIAEMNYQNQRLRIQQEADRKTREAAEEAARLEAERARQRQEFVFSSMEFDLNLLDDGIDKELKLLELRYEKELRLRSHSEEEVTELMRRQALEREAILNRSTKDALSNLDELIVGSTRSAIAQGLDPILSRSVEKQFRDLEHAHKADLERIRSSGREAEEIDQEITLAMQNYAKQREHIRKQEAAMIPQLVSQTLAGLAKEAGVESLMNLGRAAASAFTNPAASAGYLKAAAIMGSAAAAAGYASYSLAGTSYVPPPTNMTSGGESPTGSPQTATPERATAETTPMVFNINFGNSTIYDTKRAATDAFTDQVIRTMSRRRRGAPQLPFRG
jgi:hypothetical protein